MDNLIHRWSIGPRTDLQFVPAGSARGDDPARYFRSRAFQTAMAQLTDGQELAIVDAPPILDVAETTDIAHQADAVLLVVCEGTSVNRLVEARERIAMTERPIIGYVYNRATNGPKRTGYGYGYSTAIEKTTS